VKNLILSVGIGVLIISVFLGITVVFAQDQLPLLPSAEVSVSLDKRVATIGQKIHYTVTLTGGKDVEVEFPAATQMLGDFTVKEAARKTLSGFGKKKFSCRYILEAYTTGKLSIPKLVIKYKEKADNLWREASSDEQIIEVKSLLAQAKDMDDIRDIKGPITAPAVTAWFFFGGIALAALALYLSRLWKKNNAVSPAPARPAHEVALEQLEELRRRDLIGQGRIKEYFIEVSGIVRRYLEDRFNLKAPDMTTEEFLIHLRDGSQLKAEHKTLLKDFLVACDLVKFAKYSPDQGEIALTFQFARNFVEQTKAEA
jgi:hypothetical protein